MKICKFTVFCVCLVLLNFLSAADWREPINLWLNPYLPGGRIVPPSLAVDITGIHCGTISCSGERCNNVVYIRSLNNGITWTYRNFGRYPGQIFGEAEWIYITTDPIVPASPFLNYFTKEGISDNDLLAMNSSDGGTSWNCGALFI